MDTDTANDEPQEQQGLTDEQVAMLEFERSWWKHAGAKESMVRERFGVSSSVFYLRLNALIDRPEALAHDPLLVRRLLRLRAARKQQRSSRRLGFDL